MIAAFVGLAQSGSLTLSELLMPSGSFQGEDFVGFESDSGFTGNTAPTGTPASSGRFPLHGNTTLSDSDPSIDEGFVAQIRPRIHAQPGRSDDSMPAQPRDGKLGVDWIKRRDGDGQQWCDLYRVPVTHEHFNDVAGVYVIWHNGRNPVLRVGQGYIRTELSTLKLDPRIRSIAADSPVFASWAQVQRALRDGVERYLIDMLGPQIVTDFPKAEPIEVNLPC